MKQGLALLGLGILVGDAELVEERAGPLRDFPSIFSFELTPFSSAFAPAVDRKLA